MVMQQFTCFQVEPEDTTSEFSHPEIGMFVIEMQVERILE